MRIYDAFSPIFRRIQQDSIFVYAAHISFYIIISMVPFIMVLLGISEYILPLWSNEIFAALLPPVPSAVLPLLKMITEELFSRRTQLFLPFSAASLIFTASRGIAAGMRGVRRIYRGDDIGFIRSLFRSVLYTLLFLGIIILVLLLITYTVLISHSSDIACRLFRSFAGSGIIAFCLVTLAFFLVYLLFCARRLPFKTHISGALTATLSQWIFSAGYSFYIDHFGNYSAIYGSLTAIVLLFLWTYFSTVIFLLGAELNIILYEYLQKNRNYKNV